MKLKRKTLNYKNSPQSLNWKNGQLIDWVGGGNIFTLNEELIHSSRGYAYRFNDAIQSSNGIYAAIYERSGTKALLLKNGEIIREINRSYYQAGAYEYPVAFAQLESGQQVLIHCPNDYNKIEIEDLETGESLSPQIERKPDDCFHSRLRVNKSGTHFISAGWHWHPYGMMQLYNLQDAIENPLVLDNSNPIIPINSEVCSAEFLSDNLVYISSTFEEPLDDEEEDENYLEEGELGLYNIQENKWLKKVKPKRTLGNLIPIDENFVIDMYEHPKLIDTNTGVVVQKIEEIDSAKQCSSIVWDAKLPPVAVDLENKRIAIGGINKIEILEVE